MANRANKRIVPKGEPWWTTQGGWDKFAASYAEQVLELQRVFDRMLKLREWRFTSKSRLYTRMKAYTVLHARKEDEIKAAIKELSRKQAQLKAHMDNLEAAIKRGTFALTPEAWDELRERARQKIADAPLPKRMAKRKNKPTLFTEESKNQSDPPVDFKSINLALIPKPWGEE